MSNSLLDVPAVRRRGMPSEQPYSQTAESESRARWVAAALVGNSVEFHVEPLPDGAWMFTVKTEAMRVLSMVVFEGTLR